MQARGEAEGCIGWNALRGIRWHYRMHPEPSLQHHHYYNLIEIEISTQAQVCFIGRICVIIHFTIFFIIQESNAYPWSALFNADLSVLNNTSFHEFLIIQESNAFRGSHCIQ